MRPHVSFLIATMAIVSLLPTAARASSAPGWLGSRSANVAQNAIASISLPTSFASADLLVASVATDGPDTYPVTAVTTATTAVFGGTRTLHWTRAAHVSARHDVAAAGERLEASGASVTEIWTAVPPRRWSGGKTVTVTTNHPNTRDDGMVVTIAAFSNARLVNVVTLDGLAHASERVTMSVPADSAIYAATFAGRVNAQFMPTGGYHLVVQRRAGDDTAGVIASNGRDLAEGMQRVGYLSPDPGDYWEIAAAVVTAR